MQALLLSVALLLAGCAHRDPAQSWDQENLKKADNTCRTMIYRVNPATGVLEQCPPWAN